MRTSYSETKIVTLPEAKADALGFFEAVALAGLEGEYFRMSADQQRKHFGNVPFGRLSIKVDKNGIVTARRSVAFGRDFDTQEGRWDQSAKCWVSAFSGLVYAGNVFPR